MVLVVPMSGEGKRFRNVGYEQLKPLITVDGRPILAHVLDMYPSEKDVLLVCNERHLNAQMRSELLAICPHATIIGVPPPAGPVAAVRSAYDLIPDDQEVLVSYCDFTGKWDYELFKQTVREKDVDGCIPSYIGFHPHLLGNGYYGHMRWDDENLMLEIKEKSSFTDNKMDEYGAVGSYWFRSGALMKQYFDEAVAAEMKTGDEYFCSLPYNLMVRDGKKVLIYEMEQFCQWGTPEDLEEYEAWSRAMATLIGKRNWKGATLIPPSREHLVKCRNTTPESLKLTFEYWRRYFNSVDWHPYSDGSDSFP